MTRPLRCPGKVFWGNSFSGRYYFRNSSITYLRNCNVVGQRYFGITVKDRSLLADCANVPK